MIKWSVKMNSDNVVIIVMSHGRLWEIVEKDNQIMRKIVIFLVKKWSDSVNKIENGDKSLL